MEIKQFYYKNNRFQQLKGFYNVVQKNGVANAAKVMGVSQSAISIQIKSLEDDLGVKLFNRSKRSLSLTDEGKELYKMVIEPLQSIDGIFERFINVSKKLQESLDISSNHISILYLLPNLIKQFKDKNKDTRIMLRNIPREVGMERLFNNETDICIYPFLDVPVECDFIPVADYQPILLVRKDHPLATKENLRLEDVSKYDLIRIDPHLITLPNFEKVIKMHKLGSNIRFENGDWEILKKLVAAEAGVAIISNICLEPDEDTLVGIPLPDYFPKMTYGMCLKKGVYPTEAIREFLHLIEEFKKNR